MLSYHDDHSYRNDDDDNIGGNESMVTPKSRRQKLPPRILLVVVGVVVVSFVCSSTVSATISTFPNTKNNTIIIDRGLLRSSSSSSSFSRQPHHRQLVEYVLGATNKEEEIMLLKQSLADRRAQKVREAQIRFMLSGIDSNDNVTRYRPIDPDLTAIVHLGPQKTGLQKIQEMMLDEEMMEALDQDRYKKVPDRNDMTAYGFTRCFDYEDVKRPKDPPNIPIDYKCYPEVVEDTIQIARPLRKDLFHKSYHLIFTSDTIPEPELNPRLLHQFMTSHWSNVYIVGYYRRWFRWIVGLHHETMKYRSIPHRTPLHKELDDHNHLLHNVYHTYYYYGVMKRLEKFFPYHNLPNRPNPVLSSTIADPHHQIRHYHLNHLNRPNVVEHFFCTVLSSAPTACTTAKKLLQDKGGLAKNSDAMSNIYHEMAYYANELHYITNDIIVSSGNDRWMKDVALVTKYRHLITLEKKDHYYDFGNVNAIQCPQQISIDLLWNMTIATETEFFPQYQEEEIRHEFQQYIDKKLFCHLDAKMILLDSTDHWKEFYQSLTVEEIQNMKIKIQQQQQSSNH